MGWPSGPQAAADVAHFDELIVESGSLTIELDVLSLDRVRHRLQVALLRRDVRTESQCLRVCSGTRAIATGATRPTAMRFLHDYSGARAADLIAK